VPVFKNNSRLVGRLGSGSRILGLLWSGICVRAIVFNKIPQLVGRLGSGMQVNAIFFKFALTAAGYVLERERKCPGGECSGEYVRGGMSRGEMSYIQ